MAEWHDTTEEYLEAILEIEEEGIVPIRARLVERLGLSAPAVSETVNRLVDHGYARAARRSQPPAHRQGPRGGDLDRAAPPARRAAPRRRDRARVGEGPQGGRPLGARHLRRGRGEAGPAARRPGHLPARQPDPRLEPQGGGPGVGAAHPDAAGPGRRPPHQREGRDRRRTPSTSSPAPSSPRGRTRRSSVRAPTACR